MSIAGNPDVKDRFENFFAKVYGTGEIKMVPDEVAQHGIGEKYRMGKTGRKIRSSFLLSAMGENWSFLCIS